MKNTFENLIENKSNRLEYPLLKLTTSISNQEKINKFLDYLCSDESNIFRNKLVDELDFFILQSMLLNLKEKRINPEDLISPVCNNRFVSQKKTDKDKNSKPILWLILDKIYKNNTSSHGWFNRNFKSFISFPGFFNVFVYFLQDKKKPFVTNEIYNQNILNQPFDDFFYQTHFHEYIQFIQKKWELEPFEDSNMFLTNLIQAPLSIHEKKQILSLIHLSQERQHILIKNIPDVVLKQGLFTSVFNIFSVWGYSPQNIFELCMKDEGKENCVSTGLINMFDSKILQNYTFMFTPSLLKKIEENIYLKYFWKIKNNIQNETQSSCQNWTFYQQQKMIPSLLTEEKFKNFVNDNLLDFNQSMSSLEKLKSNMINLKEHFILKEKLYNEISNDNHQHNELSISMKKKI